MCKATRDEELTLIVLRKLHHNILSKGWRALADIYSHVNNAPFNHSYELSL